MNVLRQGLQSLKCNPAANLTLRLGGNRRSDTLPFSQVAARQGFTKKLAIKKGAIVQEHLQLSIVFDQ